jgi:hypothetical protein
MITVSEKGTMKIKYDSSRLLAWRTDSFKEVLKAEPTSIKLLGSPGKASNEISIVTVLSTDSVHSRTVTHGIHISLIRFYKRDTGNYAVKTMTKQE